MKRALIIGMSLSAVVVLHAQPAWVASNGVDGPSCGARSAPCATFQQAYNNTAAGGIVKAADSGEFGSLTIAHAVTIDGSGVGAEITVSGSTSGITIESGAADSVTIQGLSIHITGSGAGISGTLSSQIYLSDVTITGSPEAGIRLVSSFAPEIGRAHV